jgi:hypothetical protein
VQAVAPPLFIRLRRAAFAALVGGAVMFALYVGALPCYFAKLTHHPCPGCGSTRAVWALLRGDLHGVIQNNPGGPAMAILLGILGVQTFLSLLRYGDFRGAVAGKSGVLMKRLFLFVAALEVILWIARFFGFFGGPVAV